MASGRGGAGGCASAGLSLQVGIGAGTLMVRCCQGVHGGALEGQWSCHDVGSGTLVSEGERPYNQHEMEGGRGEGGGEREERDKGGRRVGCCEGGIAFVSTITVLEKIIKSFHNMY